MKYLHSMNHIVNAVFQVMILSFLVLTACSNEYKHITNQSEMQKQITKSEEEWRRKLTPLQFSILREKGTERPYTGIYDKHFEEGAYHCAGCDAELFRSDTKFDSGCGWPSYFEPATKDAIDYKKDFSFGMIRIEVVCSRCGGHLGHVFDDGPEPTGKRYCINSASLLFKPDAGHDTLSAPRPDAE